MVVQVCGRGHTKVGSQHSELHTCAITLQDESMHTHTVFVHWELPKYPSAGVSALGVDSSCTYKRQCDHMVVT